VDEFHKAGTKRALSPALEEFRVLIEGNPRIYMYFTAMWDEVPHRKPYDRDPSGEHRQIRDYTHMLDVLNHILHKAPQWTDAQFGVGMVGVPMCGLFDYVMATPR
jgi:phosphatidylserine decarboxylase